jgi:hypothetical protein
MHLRLAVVTSYIITSATHLTYSALIHQPIAVVLRYAVLTLLVDYFRFHPTQLHIHLSTNSRPCVHICPRQSRQKGTFRHFTDSCGVPSLGHADAGSDYERAGSRNGRRYRIGRCPYVRLFDSVVPEVPRRKELATNASGDPESIQSRQEQFHPQSIWHEFQTRAGNTAAR